MHFFFFFKIMNTYTKYWNGCFWGMPLDQELSVALSGLCDADKCHVTPLHFILWSSQRPFWRYLEFAEFVPDWANTESLLWDVCETVCKCTVVDSFGARLVNTVKFIDAIYIHDGYMMISMMILVLKMQHFICTNLLLCILHILGIFNIYVVSFVLCKDSSEPY